MLYIVDVTGTRPVKAAGTVVDQFLRHVDPKDGDEVRCLISEFQQLPDLPRDWEVVSFRLDDKLMASQAAAYVLEMIGGVPSGDAVTVASFNTRMKYVV